MTQLTNDYIYEIIGNQQFPYGEDIVIGTGAATTQTGAAYPIKSQCHRIISCGTSGAALMMRSILSLDNPQLVILINDSANSVNIFPFKAFGVGAIDTAENINGAATAFPVGSLTSAVFWASLVQTKRKGSATVNALNWSAATFS